MPAKQRQEKNDHALKVLLEYMRQRHEGQAKSAAKRLGVSRSMISELQAGTRGFGLKMLEALARETGLTIEQINGEDSVDLDTTMGASEVAKRQFLGLFHGTERTRAESYVADKETEAARLPSGWSAYDIVSRYWIPGYDAWRALQRGKVTPVIDVQDMSEDEATPAFVRKTGTK